MNWQTLVSVAELSEALPALPAEALRVVDVRHQLSDADYGERAYRQAHLPGAVFMHCDRDLAAPLTGQNGRHPLPDPAILAARLGALGISRKTQVVVLDDLEGMIAGRLWWMLRAMGHRDVALLDGGWKAWLAAGGALTTALPSVTPTVYPVAPWAGVVDAAYVREHLESSAMCLVDARSPDRFRGENETLDPLGGHIPGALNRFFRDNLAADGCFKPAQTLRAEWLAFLAGRAPQTVVHQCGSGVSACHNLLAMTHAGLPASRLYAGSWSEWCAYGDHPVAH